MSYEAVPCMVRAPSQDGTKGAILGVIIRPSSSQDGNNVSSLPTPPGVIPIKGAKSIVIQPGSKRSLIISNDQIQKMVNGMGVRVSPLPQWNPLPTSSANSSILPSPQLASPQSTEMGDSSSSSHRLHSDVIASSTPDSGIQSVPTTPPQTSVDHKSEEIAEDEVKFDDMPRLRPVDEEESTACSSSSIPPALDESSVWHTSECETSLPSKLTSNSWNPEEIATQLLSMAAFDPQKIQEVTALMLQRSKEDVSKSEGRGKKRRRDMGPPPTGKKKLKGDECDMMPSTSKNTMDNENNKEMSEEEVKRSDEEPLDEASRLVIYRLAVRRRLATKVQETSDQITQSLSRLSVGNEIRKTEEHSINPIFRPIRWDTIIARKRNLSEILAEELKERKRKMDADKERRATLNRKIRYEDNASKAQISAKKSMKKRVKEVEKQEKRRKRRSDIDLTRHTDTSYLDAAPPVGSYNADEWNGGDRSTNEEGSVRCVCGILEDDGEMVECDECHFWLHSDCIEYPSTESFKCPLCVECTSTPHGDVILKDLPTIRLDSAIYFKALENRRKIQVRLNECVYVSRPSNDEHKKLLRRSSKAMETEKDSPLMKEPEERDTLHPRSHLRVFRVERLFESPGGHRFLFGFYYARPHETFCDQSRLFHTNEVFATPFYDTLPLDVVVGKCVVMDAALFCAGRPLFPSYKDPDVLVCEYQLDRHQRHFDKCKNHYFVNTEPYAFKKFKRTRTLQRCFTPFSYSSTTTPSAITSSQE